MSFKSENKTLHFYSRIAAGLISLVLIFGTAIPLSHSEEWWVRIFDFPRLQIFILLVIMLSGYATLRLIGHLRSWEYIIILLVALSLIWQLICIAPYTVLYPKQMSDSQSEDNSNRVSLLIYNVLSENKEVDALRDLIRETDPDIILLSEPTQWWLEQLEGLQEDYPYTLFRPQENHYGKLLYSRLELIDPEIRFLIEPEIPSILTLVKLRSGTIVTLYGVHPRPPGLKSPDKQEDEPQEDGDREDSDMRDAELLTVAKEVRDLGDVPVIVAGDFNDVAWSRSTHLFQRTGGLLDPRVGRGFINTFNTKSRLLRFPLDHVFASQHFLLVELRRLPHIGSDHFPVLVVLDFDPDASEINKKPQQDSGDEEDAEEAIEEETTEE